MQKYNKGDHVQVAKDLGKFMDHFQNDCEAIVMYTYNEKFGGGNIDSYCIHIKGRGQVAWYYEHQLELIEVDRVDLLKQWETEEEKEADMKSNIDWIFSHGKEVLEETHGATIAALAKCFGLMNLWGSSGEGITYYSNARVTINMAKPFLESGDKEGWFRHCKTLINKEA